MKDYTKDFPYTKTKTNGAIKKFDLSDIEGRKAYFEEKVGVEIEKLNKYFEKNSFIAYFLAKKNAGKGTYTKLMMEIFGKDYIGHISIGDLVRQAHNDMEDENKEKELREYLEENYRGYISIDEAIDALLGRNAKTLLPTELILILAKREIDKMGKKSIFVDGFPRELDQVSYSLFFRDLIDYRTDPDIFVAIEIPEVVVDERMKNRVVCPKCQTPRSMKLLATKEAGFDEIKKEFYLMCDNPECGNARMVSKEGDSAGIESIRERLDKDDQLIDKVFSLHGIPKILLRNAIPTDIANDYIDDYEATPEYSYELDENSKEVKINENPWLTADDQGRESYSLLAPPVVVSLIKQLVKVLNL